MRKRWRKFRNIMPATLAEPEIKKIRLYDLRHYYGTMTYHICLQENEEERVNG